MRTPEVPIEGIEQAPAEEANNKPLKLRLAEAIERRTESGKRPRVIFDDTFISYVAVQSNNGILFAEWQTNTNGNPFKGWIALSGDGRIHGMSASLVNPSISSLDEVEYKSEANVSEPTLEEGRFDSIFAKHEELLDTVVHIAESGHLASSNNT